jgi:transcriptional regulator with XRE-family HTH domain
MTWTEIECRVLPALIPERERFIKRLNEDENSKPYSAYEKMLSMERLKEQYNLSQKRIAEALDVSEAWISQNLTIVKIPELKAYLENGGDFNKAKHLSRIKNKIDRIAILGSLDNYTTAQLERIVSDAKNIDVIKPPLESPEIASDEESDPTGEEEDDEYPNSIDECHASEDSSAVHPIQTSGESEDDGEEGNTSPRKAPSPDGEPVKDGEDQTQEDETSIPPSPTESSPSKWQRQRKLRKLLERHLSPSRERNQKDHIQSKEGNPRSV